MTEHGTYSGYVLGCRCNECRAAANKYQRDYSRRQREDAKKWRELQAALAEAEQ